MPNPASPLLDAARFWFNAGFCVIPSHEDGGKRPFGQWKKYQLERPDWPTLEGWLTSGRYTGIGLIMGQASGNAEMLEIEGPGNLIVERVQQLFDTAHALDLDGSLGLVALMERIYHGCAETSAGGGLHIFVKVSDGPVPGNTKLAGTPDKVIAETRGEGGFVIVWPTPARNGHEPGAAYLLLPNAHPDNAATVTASELEWIHAVFTDAFGGWKEPAKEAAPKPAAPPPVSTQSTGLSPFDDYRQRVTWRDILEPAGWTWHSSDADHDYWTRPGKDKRDGHSASTIEDGPFYLFSSSVTGMPIEQGLSKGQVYAHLNHDGDLSAATRQLRSDGYGDETGPLPDLRPWEYDPTLADLQPQDAKLQWVTDNLGLIDWQQLWDDQSEEEWIAYPLLPARRLIALYSAPKVGKSLLLLELAAGIASGRPVLGNPAGPQRVVLYVDFENDPKADIRERLQNMGYGPADLGNLKVLSFPNMGALDSAKGSEQLMAAVEAFGAEVVIIDTVSRAISGDENENDTWLDFYRHTGLKLKQAEVALVRLDHAGKDEAKGQRGGSAKSGDVDAVWRMSRTSDDLYDLICEANRMPIDPESRILTIERVDGERLEHIVKGDKIRAKREALDAAIADCGPYPEGQQGWKKVRQVVRQKHTIRASNDAWQAAVRRHFEGLNLPALVVSEDVS
jgi:hypothetical protein